MFKMIFKNSIPMIISMLISSLYNIIDSYFVSSISDNAMTALSLVFPIQNLIIAVSVGFGIGVNACVSYYLGKKDKTMANKSASIGFYLSIIQGIILVFICLGLLPLFLKDYKDTIIYEYAMRYSLIVFIFSFSYSVQVYFEKLFQALNYMKISMLAMSIGCVLNIILDPIFIKYFSIEGAAIATIIAQFLSLIIYVIFYFKMKLEVKITKDIKGVSSILKKMYITGIPAMFNMILPSILIFLLNNLLTKIDSTNVLILGGYYKLQTFIYLTCNGLVQGIRPLISYNYGKGDYKMVKNIIKYSNIIALIIMLIGTILSLIIPKQLMSIFMENKEIIEKGSKALMIISTGFIISSISVIIMGALEALSKGVESLFIAVLRYILVYIISVIFINKLNELAVWISFPLSELIALFASIIIYAIINKKMLKEN